MEYANCEACHAPYNTRGKRPIILPCNHTLCLECQISLKRPRCPFCKKVFAPDGDIKTNIPVFQMVAERDQQKNLKPSVNPTTVPTEVSQKYEEIKSSKVVKRPNIVNKAEKYRLDDEELKCPQHEGEILEWFVSDETQSCLICKSSTIPQFGHWRCKYLDYFICITCKPPILNSCPGHENIPLEWINRVEDNPKLTTCKICKKESTAKNIVICPKGCILCKKCHSTHFTTIGYVDAELKKFYPKTIGYQKSRLAKINEFYEYTSDALNMIHWVMSGGIGTFVVHMQKFSGCMWCKTPTGYSRIDSKGNCFMRSPSIFACSDLTSRICKRCLLNNCSFHPDTPVLKHHILACFNCHSYVPVKGGGWVCPKGDMALCRKCMFYPNNLCPQHPRKLMILNSNSDIAEKCSVCLTHNGTWKCKECQFFVCNKCTVPPLFCPSHTDRDLVYTTFKKKPICSMCYKESSDFGCYSCPESDYFLCDECYKRPDYSAHHGKGWVCPLHPNQNLKYNTPRHTINCDICKEKKNGEVGVSECTHKHSYQVINYYLYIIYICHIFFRFVLHVPQDVLRTISLI